MSKLLHKISFTRIGTTALGEAWRGLLNGMFDSYRPELHYMRGPGPKWRARHQVQTGA